MRINPLHLRIALLVLNLAAAVGVPAYAALSYLKTGEDVGTLDIADPADLIFREGETDLTAGRGPQQLISVGGWVMPSRAVAETSAGELTPEASTVPKPPSDSGELLPGPLAEEPHNLEYVTGITYENTPKHNLIVLRKKDAAGAVPGAAAASNRSSVRRTTTPQRPARVTVGGRRQVGQPSESISFFVYRRRYTDKERGLDFMIHSSDAKQFVYWLPDNPKKMYALQKVTDSDYYKDKEAGLRPTEKTPDELAAEEEKVQRFIFHDRKDVEVGVEDEYKEMLQGKGAGPLLSPKKDGAGAEKAPAGSSSPRAPGGSAARAVPKFGAKDGPEPRTVMTDDEKQQLREALRSPKMSQKDREELQKALMGAPGAK
jgi:hypothetical protein